MEEAGTHMAEITEFVPLESVDPVYFDKAYYLAPDKGGAKPYALLASALRESKRCALGRWAARGKQYIVMIRPVDDGLVMQQLLYAGEVRAMKELEIPKTEVKPAELKLAQQLIEQQTSDTFDPSAYTDEVAARIEAAVQKKVEGQEITLAEAPEGGAQVIDLMEALRASLEKKAPARGKAAEPRGCAPNAKPAKRAQPARKPPRRRRASARRKPSGASRGNRERAVHPYGVRDVETLLRLSRSTIRSLIAAGFVTPTRGPRGAWRFSFQDLIVLRTAQALVDANVPRAANHALDARAPRQLPETMPLSGLSHRRRGRPRRRPRGRQPLAGGLGPIRARVRGRPGRRARSPSSSASAAGAAARPMRDSGSSGDRRWSGTDAEARGRRVRARDRPRSGVPRRAHQSGTAAARDGAARERGPRLSRGDTALRQRSRPALQPRRAPRRPGSPAGRGRRLRGGARERSRLRRLPLQPCARCTRSSRNPGKRCGTWRGIARSSAPDPVMAQGAVGSRHGPGHPPSGAGVVR